FVLTKSPLCEVVPIGNAAMEDRTFVEWDKDDLDALGMLKVDVLALGMLTCIRKCFFLLQQHYGLAHTLASIPADDKPTYDMLCRADSLGVFQVESRAQMNMLPRLRPARFYDLVIQVAIVRPGPIQGDMVHPYLRRRDGLDDVVYPSPAPPADPDELRNILGRTLGVPLFQEQAMQIAIDAAKFSPEEANLLRKAMATFRRSGTIHTLQDKMVGQMIERGYDPDFSRRCFDQIKGFGEYGFPESHAASFALLVYVSSWIKCHYPDAFCAGLLNAQPMGFYAPAQIVRDAKEHGIEVRPIDVNHSSWDNTLEENHDGSFAVRLGFRQADGLREDMMNEFVLRRQQMSCPFTSLDHIRRRTSLSVAVLERLAANDAFRSIDMDRRQALWAVRGLMSDTQLPLFAAADESSTGLDVPVRLPQMRTSEHVVSDYQTHRLSLKAHPLSFLRASYRKQGMIEAQDLFNMRQKQRCTIAGVVLVRQRPGTAKGVVFMTIEDETGVANIVIWKKTMERFRKTVMGARLVCIKGEVQRAGEVIHVVAHRLDDLTHDLDRLSDDELPEVVAHGDHMKSPQVSRRPPDKRPDFLANADEVRRGSHDEEYLRTSRADRERHAGMDIKGKNTPQRDRPAQNRQTVPGRGTHPRNVRIIPKSRDFH
ncbi:MAG: OB-fold nucleic acid binding domain-containing protein, partial [Rhizobiaceae bacterium]